MKRTIVAGLVLAASTVAVPTPAQAAPPGDADHWYSQYVLVNDLWLSCEQRAHVKTTERDQFEALSLNQAVEIEGLNRTVRELDELWYENQETIRQQENTISRLRQKIRGLRFQLNNQ
jgi:hypothetical protein